MSYGGKLDIHDKRPGMVGRFLRCAGSSDPAFIHESTRLTATFAWPAREPLTTQPRNGKSFLDKHKGLEMNGVLVLNASYEPLNVVSVRRAIVLLLKEKAELLEAAEAQIRAEQIAFQRPLVIRLVMYVKIPRRLLTLPLTRRNVLKRDNYTCQYCGRRPDKAELTLDHIVPRSRGGGHTWENLVAACAPCNRRKGDNLPSEVGMPLQRKPYKPRYLALTLMSEAAPTAWTKYMYY